MKDKNEMDISIGNSLNCCPNITYFPAYDPVSSKEGTNEWANIKALTYDGIAINGKKTKVFAYIGFPENAVAGKLVPAMVLVHGGGGHAFAEWIKIWNDRGFAAIAMDTTGHFPSSTGKGIAGRESDNRTDYWTHGMTMDFAENGFVDAPDNNMDNSNACDAPYEEQWLFHAITRVILAHNLLRADTRIDSNRIGLTGISWGGVISSLVIGYDNRYAFAIPIYGSGFLSFGLSAIQANFKNSDTKRFWSAEDRFSNVAFPVLWLAWSRDPCFSIHSNSLSYLATKSQGAILSLQMDMGHSHYSGWILEESYRFAKSIVLSGEGLAQFIDEPQGTWDISMTIKVPHDAINVIACIYYLTETMTYSFKPEIDSGSLTIDQEWYKTDAIVKGDIITARLHDDAKSYYVMITTETPEGRFVTTSSYVELNF